MARVAVLCPDLLFGSRVEGGLGAAGHEVERVASVAEARAAAARSELLVVDLTTDEVDGVGMVEAMRASGELASVPTLGFYAHVDVEVRRGAEAAGFDLVVPRSRMAREMGALAETLLAGRSATPG